MFKKLRSIATVLLSNKLVRFFLVSGLNTAFGYGLFAILLYLGMNYPLALLLSTILGILFNFKTMGVLVFENSNNRLIFRFFGVYGITYLCNLGLLALLKFLGLNLYVAGAILIIPIGIFAFLLNRAFVYKMSNQTLS